MDSFNVAVPLVRTPTESSPEHFAIAVYGLESNSDVSAYE